MDFYKTYGYSQKTASNVLTELLPEIGFYHYLCGDGTLSVWQKGTPSRSIDSASVRELIGFFADAAIAIKEQRFNITTGQILRRIRDLLGIDVHFVYNLDLKPKLCVRFTSVCEAQLHSQLHLTHQQILGLVDELESIHWHMARGSVRKITVKVTESTFYELTLTNWSAPGSFAGCDRFMKAAENGTVPDSSGYFHPDCFYRKTQDQHKEVTISENN